jgi:release factor glutamine methyltransferase
VAGYPGAAPEARILIGRAGGDPVLLESMTARRLTGEPLDWITGTTAFCGLELHLEPGVYVPRPHTELIARRAATLLPVAGTAIDVCTGSGAIAAVLKAHRPGARVLASDVDERAVRCARANGVDASLGDLFAPLPRDGPADVVTGVPPYVPTSELATLQRDTFTFESARAYAGGADGADLLRRVIAEAPSVLRPGGALVLEVGGDQPRLLEADLARHGYTRVALIADGDGDVRGIEATLG